MKEKLAKPDIHLKPWGYVLYAHIVTGSQALVLGPVQFWMKPVRKQGRLHRLLGMVYVLSIGFSGMVSLYLALTASGGLAAQLGFAGMAVSWMGTTVAALAGILRGQVAAHRKWMLRSYAVTLSAVMFRLYLFPLKAALGSFDLAYALCAWLTWVPNLLLLEAYLAYRRSRWRTYAAPGTRTAD